MAKKPKVSKQIREAGKGLAQVMRDKLTIMADDLIKQVMNKSKRLTPSQKLNAVKGITPRGVFDYKDSVKNALSVIALDALEGARKEVPKKKHVRLAENEDAYLMAEFERLPPALQKKVKLRMDLLVGKQIGDLQKVIEFAYLTAEEETDSEEQIQADLNDSAVGWLDSTSMDAGAELSSASIINSARQAFFFDDEVLQEIEAFEFMNGDPVTEICQDLAGTVFSKDDPGADSFFPPLHWNALINNTQIETNKGVVAIENLQLGDLVLTHKNRYRPVTEVMSKFEDKDYFEVTLENGKVLEITGEHPVLTPRGWVRADQLLITDDLICFEDLSDE